jgi:hypothetical protein
MLQLYGIVQVPSEFHVVVLQMVPSCGGRRVGNTTPALVSVQTLLLWHTRLCATTYSCYLSGYLSGSQGDFVSMARHLALCLAMVSLLQVVPQNQQSGSIKTVPREAELAGKQVKRGSGACGLDSRTRLVRLQPGASEGTRQGNNVDWLWAKRGPEQGGGDGMGCQVPRHKEGQTVR